MSASPSQPPFTYLRPHSIQHHARLQIFSPLISESRWGTRSHWLSVLSIKASDKEAGAVPSPAVCQWTQQSDSGTSTHKCPHGKRLPVGALARVEGPGAPAGDPKRGGSRPLCAIPLHRVGKYRHVCYLFIYFFYLPLQPL